MSTLYYKVNRNKLLTNQELNTIKSIVNNYLENEEVCELAINGGGELFSIDETNIDKNILFQGSTKLPINLFPEQIDDFIYVVEYWFDILSELRNNILDSEWDVTIDDHIVIWNPAKRVFEQPNK